MTNDEHETLLIAAVLRAARSAAAHFTGKPGWDDDLSRSVVFSEIVGESVYLYLCDMAQGKFCNGIFDKDNVGLEVARETGRTFVDAREADPALGAVDDALAHALERFYLYHKDRYAMLGHSEQETEQMVCKLAERLREGLPDYLNEYVKPGRGDVLAKTQDEWPDIIDG